jgi:hypothetical protein
MAFSGELAFEEAMYLSQGKLTNEWTLHKVSGLFQACHITPELLLSVHFVRPLFEENTPTAHFVYV